MIARCGRYSVSGTIEAPASKSSMQRAIACAALAEGESRLKFDGRALCSDAEAAIGIARALGAAASVRGAVATVRGSPLFSGVGASSRASGTAGGSAAGLVLDCEESGLCMRMFSPVAALLDSEVRLEGSGSLSGRPMRMVETSISAFGAECRTTGGHQPISVRGPLAGGKVVLDAGESSQLLTGLLIALPLASEDSEIKVLNAVSVGYLDLTIDTCAAFGARIERNEDFSAFFVPGGQRYRSTDFTVEGDWSGAAFLVAAAAIAAGESGLRVRGLKADSRQPDRAVMQAASAAGAAWRIGADELLVGRARGLPFEFDATDCPDLFPPLAALASSCQGVSSIRGVHRLRGKESDRAASLKDAFGALGIPVWLEGDTMRVKGGSLHGGEIDSRGDHRIAMAAAVAALGAGRGDEVAIRGAECVSKSWPSFFEDLDSLCSR